jgi:hypothetical protein
MRIVDGTNVFGMASGLSTRSAAVLLAGVVLAWGPTGR